MQHFFNMFVCHFPFHIFSMMNVNWNININSFINWKYIEIVIFIFWSSVMWHHIDWWFRVWALEMKVACSSKPLSLTRLRDVIIWRNIINIFPARKTINLIKVVISLICARKLPYTYINLQVLEFVFLIIHGGSSL